MSAGTSALIVGGVVAAGGITAAVISANAQKSAANASLTASQQQVGMAQTALQQQIAARQQGITQATAAAQLSPGEIQAIQSILQTQSQALNANLQGISMSQQKLDAMDPNVKAAGADLYALLNGESSKILAPIQQQQQMQRQALVNQLSSTMGPGYATSSAGIAALTQFDNQSAITLNQAQIGAITTVGAQYQGMTAEQFQGQSAITQQLMAAFGQSQTANSMVQQGYQVAQTRITNATLGAMSDNPLNPFGVPGAQQSVIGAAGPAAGAYGSVMGSGIAQASAGVGQTAGTYAGYNMFANALGNKNTGVGTGVPAGSVTSQVPQVPNLNPGGIMSSPAMAANPFAAGGADWSAV